MRYKFFLTCLILVFQISSTTALAAQRRETRSEVMDVPYAKNPSEHQKLDLYMPTHPDPQSLAPLVIWIHGAHRNTAGDFETGDKGALPPKFFRNSGFVMASINYRMGSEAIFPAPLQDCYAAFQYLRNNAEYYGIDRNKITIFGASVGGQLATLLAEYVLTKNAQAENRAPNNVTIKAVAEWSGPSDLLTYAKQDKKAPKERHGPDGFVAKMLGGLPEDKPELAKAASSSFPC
jgi:acetyl esterase/lipase